MARSSFLAAKIGNDTREPTLRVLQRVNKQRAMESHLLYGSVVITRYGLLLFPRRRRRLVDMEETTDNVVREGFNIYQVACTMTTNYLAENIFHKPETVSRGDVGGTLSRTI